MFEDDTHDIRVGERVIMDGVISILNNKGKSYPLVYVNSIEYNSREEVILTEQDIQAIRRFVYTNGPNTIKKLRSMVAPHIIGYEEIKEGILYSAVSDGSRF